MASYKITIVEIAELPLVEDLNVRNFIRQINATPRRRKAKNAARLSL